MANDIALAEKYLPLLDEVYQVSSLTSVLDKPAEFIGANTVKYLKVGMSGLGNYNRSTGYATGDVTAVWESMKLQRDRGRAFIIDRMDAEEAGLEFARLAGEFIRTQVVREIDAYTFAVLAGTQGIGSANGDISVGTTDVANLIDTAIQKMGDAEVPVAQCILYISETAYQALKTKINRSIANEGEVNREVQKYGEMRIVRVPQARFNTSITLLDGKTEGQENGGYIIPAGSYKINFMIVHPAAVNKVAKHVMPRIFSPDTYQQADAWKFDYRIYHDCFVFDNKVKGIYMHRANTANA